MYESIVHLLKKGTTDATVLVKNAARFERLKGLKWLKELKIIRRTDYSLTVEDSLREAYRFKSGLYRG